MAVYRRVYDSRHLQAGCQEPRDQLRNPTLGNRVRATFTILCHHLLSQPLTAALLGCVWQVRRTGCVVGWRPRVPE